MPTEPISSETLDEVFTSFDLYRQLNEAVDYMVRYGRDPGEEAFDNLNEARNAFTYALAQLRAERVK